MEPLRLRVAASESAALLLSLLAACLVCAFASPAGAGFSALRAADASISDHRGLRIGFPAHWEDSWRKSTRELGPGSEVADAAAASSRQAEHFDRQALRNGARRSGLVQHPSAGRSEGWRSASAPSIARYSCYGRECLARMHPTRALILLVPPCPSPFARFARTLPLAPFVALHLSLLAPTQPPQ